MAELLTAEQVSEGITTLDGWSGDGAGIRRTVTLDNFPMAISVVGQVAIVAEELDHHPDIDIRWRDVTFVCSTHSSGGVTEKDLDLAARIDAVVDGVLATDVDAMGGPGDSAS